MNDQELLTGVPTDPCKRITALLQMFERSSEPSGLVGAAADTYPYVKHALIEAVREDADRIAELELNKISWKEEFDIVVRERNKYLKQATKAEAKNIELQEQLEYIEWVGDNPKAYAAELHQLESRLDAVQWQPIETAPKDGTTIIAYGMSRPCSGIMPQAKPEEFLRTIAYRHGNWQAGWVNAIPVPTHWMPLPEPPQALNGEGDG